MKTNNRQHIISVYDQGSRQGSCVSNAVAQVLRYLSTLAGKTFEPSREFIYYTTRAMENRLDKEGTDPYDVATSIQHSGICTEALWPYDDGHENVPPTTDACADALTRNKIKWQKIPINKDEFVITYRAFRNAILQGIPVLIAMPVSDRIRTMSGPLETQNYLPTGTGPSTDYLGNHELLWIDIDDDMVGGSYIALNSWSDKWGDAGYGRFGYASVMDVYAAYVITGFGDFEMPFTPYDPTPIVDYPAQVKHGEPFTWTIKNGIPYSQWHAPWTINGLPIGITGGPTVALDKNGEGVYTDSWQWLAPGTHRFEFQFEGGFTVLKTCVVLP